MSRIQVALFVLMSFSSLSLWNAASAGTVTNSDAGTCTALHADGFNTVTYDQTVSNSSATQTSISDRYLVTNPSTSASIECWELTIIQYENNTSAPSKGTSNSDVSIVDKLSNVENKTWLLYGTGLVAISVCGATGGIPCAIATSFGAGIGFGIQLNENSPAYITYTPIDADRSAIPSFLEIPFVVTNVGDGDWLSLSNRGQEFWRQPLSNFAEGQSYSAVVPNSVLGPELPVWTFFLESAGSANAQVVFPTSVVPVPAAVWLFGSGLLGLVGIARRKKAA